MPTDEPTDDDLVIVTTPACFMCGKSSRIALTGDQYRRLMGSDDIQRALPDLTADQRELLLTGTDPECWELLRPPDEDA